MFNLPTKTSNINNKEIKFEVKSDKNNLFYIQFYNKGNILLISSYYKNKNKKIEYESEFELSYIKQIKLFTMYDTLDECLYEIFAGINTGKSQIFEDNNSFNLFIPLNNIKYKEISFKIEKKEKILGDSKNNHLNKIINKQNEEIEMLKNKIEILENIVKELMIFKKEVERKKHKKIKIESYIINNNDNYKKYLKNWINPNENVRTVLLYRLSRDGDSIKTFHNLCDNISPNLILVESLNGNISGGYTTCTWDTDSGDKKDNKTFLFSLTKDKIFHKRKDQIDQRDIYCDSSYGPVFGGNEFYFDESMKKCFSWYPFYFLDDKDLSDNNENKYFEVKELEVYKIIFD
jgi:hypothetical protein